MSSTELFFSDSSSDFEDENLVQLRRQRIHRIRDHLNPLELDTNMFQKNFRLSKEAFLFVLTRIDEKLSQGSYSTKIPNILKLCITLRFFAQVSYQLGIGNEGAFGVAQTTVSAFLAEMLHVMESTLCAEFIDFANTTSETEKSKQFFYSKCGIPGVVGAIDGTHIKLIAPKKELQHLYYNRKEFFSINAMIVCDHNMKIRCINAKHPGSCHDSMVFGNSNLKMLLERQYENGLRNIWLLGDAGYGLQPYLLTPFRNAEPGTIESRYTMKHAKVRNIIERAIEVFKNRWRCLLGARALHYSPNKATKITNVCAALHNICITYSVVLDEEILPIPNVVPEVINNEEGHSTHNEAEKPECFKKLNFRICTYFEIFITK